MFISSKTYLLLAVHAHAHWGKDRRLSECYVYTSALNDVDVEGPALDHVIPTSI
jgi:hypothetical protein